MANPYEDVLLARFDSIGNVAWANRYDVQGSHDEGNAVTVDFRPPPASAKNFAFVVAGTARTNFLAGGPLYNEDGLLLHANAANGAPQVSEVLGGAQDDRLYDVLDNTSGYAVAVGGNSSYFPQRRAWLVERYDSIAQACHDLRFKPTWVKIPLPIEPPIVMDLLKGESPQKPITKDIPVFQQTVCEKRPWNGHGPEAKALKDIDIGVDEGNPPDCH